MTMAARPTLTVPARDRVELYSGDRMTQEEFHRAYKRMPKDFKAELIGGTVYVASPLRLPHATAHPAFGTLLFVYKSHTPGVECGDNGTIVLADDSEPQPDLFLRILPEYGGQSRTTPEQYVQGAPELVAEIAHSSRAIDLHAKRNDYTRYGVREYLVLCVEEGQLRWFDLTGNQELQPDAAGVFRLRTFPGLWIDGPGLVAQDYRRMMPTLEQGLASIEHRAFVERLAASRKVE